MVELPIKPILTDPVLQDLLDFTVPDDVTLQEPTHPETLPLVPEGGVHTSLAFTYAAYANTIQDVIDGNILTMAGYSIPSSTLNSNWIVVKDGVLRKYHRTRSELLSKEGARNQFGLSGEVRKRLFDLSMEERRELSQENLKFYKQNTDFTYEQIQTAFNEGVRSDAIRFDSHHKLQFANFQVAKAIIDAGYENVAIAIQSYNQQIEALRAQIEQHKDELRYQAQRLENWIAKLQVAGLRAEQDSMLMEAYRATVRYLVEKAKMDIIFYQTYLINAELERNKIKKYAAEIDKYTALIQANTAEYEVYKANARITKAQADAYKSEASVADANLKVQEAYLKGAEALADADLAQANAHVTAMKDIISAAESALSASYNQARAEVALDGAELDSEYAQLVGEISQIIVQEIARREAANDRGQEERASAITEGRQTAAVSKWQPVISALVMTQSLIRIAMVQAAEAAARAEVETEMIHKKGSG